MLKKNFINSENFYRFLLPFIAIVLIAVGLIAFIVSFYKTPFVFINFLEYVAIFNSVVGLILLFIALTINQKETCAQLIS